MLLQRSLCNEKEKEEMEVGSGRNQPISIEHFGWAFLTFQLPTVPQSAGLFCLFALLYVVFDLGSLYRKGEMEH